MRCLSVIAPDHNTGFYYPGIIDQSTEAATVTVWFYRRLPLTVPFGQVIVIGGAVPWPLLQIWDHTLVRVYCRTLAEAAYVPARVVVLPIHGPGATGVYTLQLYTGTLVHKRRRYIVKIGKERYHEALGTILNVRHRRPVEFQATNRLSSLLQERTNTSSLLYIAEPTSPPCLQRQISMPELWRIHPIKNRRQKTSRNKKKPNLSDLYRYKTHNATQSSRQNNSISSSDSRPSQRPRLPDISHGDTHSKRRNSARSTSTTSLPSNRNKNASLSKKNDKSPSSVATSSNDGKNKTGIEVELRHSVGVGTGDISENYVSSSAMNNGSTVSLASSSNRNRKFRAISSGQEVLARWPDDGWYYFSVVVMEIDDAHYVVRDSTGHAETIHADDILTQAQQTFDVIQPKDHVIGLHLDFLYSYAPAVVLEVYSLGVQVRFFDGAETRLCYEEVYKIGPDTYKRVVTYIRECEDRVCGGDGGVIARDDVTGFYFHCVAECANRRNEFILHLPDGTLKAQSAAHVFDRHSRLSCYNENHATWRHVLAPWDDEETGVTRPRLYLPAVIRQHVPLMVQFADGSQQTLANLRNCFYLSEHYYKNAVNVYIDRSRRQQYSVSMEHCTANSDDHI